MYTQLTLAADMDNLGKLCILMQVTDANLQLAQLLLAAQLQAPIMQSPLTLLPQGLTTGEHL